MENVHYNDVKRTTIVATIDFVLQHGTSYIDALQTTASTIYPYKTTDWNALQSSFSLLAVCFFDYYTVLSYKKRKHMLTIEEYIDFASLSQLHNILDLYIFWKKDQKSCLRAIDACYQLYQKSEEEKRICIGQMTIFEHTYLHSIYPTYAQDFKNRTKKKQMEENGWKI